MLPLANQGVADGDDDMNWHDWRGRHSPDLMASRWDNGAFVTRCTVCAREMIKPVSGTWHLRVPA